MKKQPLLLLLFWLGACDVGDAAESVPTASELARDAMLIELARLSDGRIGGIPPAGAFCFYQDMGSPSFDPVAVHEFDSETGSSSVRASASVPVASRREAKNRIFNLAPLILAPSANRRAWGTAMSGPGLGQIRGFGCSVGHLADGVRMEGCSVAWFN